MFEHSVSFYKPRLRLFLFWVTGFIAIAVLGGALTIDLTGFSAADRFMIARWGFRGLRLYLWFEAGVLVTIVTAIGWSAITTGLDIARRHPVAFPGIEASLRARVSTRLGYLLVLLGSALTALAITTLVLFNSCRYMRIV